MFNFTFCCNICIPIATDWHKRESCFASKRCFPEEKQKTCVWVNALLEVWVCTMLSALFSCIFKCFCRAETSSLWLKF